MRIGLEIVPVRPGFGVTFRQEAIREYHVRC